MKKLIIAVFTVIVFAGSAIAQAPTFKLTPEVFTAENEVTLEVNVTGTGMAGVADAYIWTWANEVNGAGAVDSKLNTAWNNSPDAAKLTKIADNVFTFKMKGTEIWNLTPGELKHFQFLIKSKDGGKKTDNSTAIRFDPLVFIPSMMRIFPARVGQNDVISLYFHQDLAATTDQQRMEPVSATVEVFDNTGASAGQPITLPLKNAGGKTWRAYFIPTRSYTPGAGKTFTRFTYKFNGTVRDVNNQPVAISTASADVPLAEMK